MPPPHRIAAFGEFTALLTVSNCAMVIMCVRPAYRLLRLDGNRSVRHAFFMPTRWQMLTDVLVMTRPRSAEEVLW